MAFAAINALTPNEKKKTPFYFLKDEVDSVKEVVHGIIASDKDPLIKYNTIVNFINKKDTVDNWLESLSAIPKPVKDKLGKENRNYLAQCYESKKFEEMKQRISWLNIPEENKQFMFDWIEREQKPIIDKRFWQFYEAKDSTTWNHPENPNKPERQGTGWIQWLKKVMEHHQELAKQLNPDSLTDHSQPSQLHPSLQSMYCSTCKGSILPAGIRDQETQRPHWMSEDKFANDDQNKKEGQPAEKSPNEVEQIISGIAADALKIQEFHHQKTTLKHEPLRAPYTSTNAPSSMSYELPPTRHITKLADIKEQISSAGVRPATTEAKQKTSPILFPVDKSSNQNMIAETSKLIETAYETVEPPLTDEGLIVVDPLPALTITSHSKIKLNTQEFGQIKIDPANYVTILLVGPHGVGKTTFINSCANFLAHNTLEDATTNPTFLTELSFSVMKDSRQYEIKVAANSGNHIASTNEQGSQTNQPVIHLIPFGSKEKGKYLRIIDTPGLEDENEILVELGKKIGQIHAACIMVPNNIRAVVSSKFRLLLITIFNYFQQDALKNIFFCFMKTAAPSFLPGESFSLLETQFKDLKVQINLKKELNIFTFNSECMRYISANTGSNTKLTKSKLDPMFPNAKSSWDHSNKEFFRLLERVQQLTPFEMSEIAIVDRNINTLVALTDSYRRALCILCNSDLAIVHAKAKLIRTQEEVKKAPTQSDQEKKEKEELARLEEVNKDIEVECNQILNICSNLFDSISKKVIATDMDPFLDYITQQLKAENEKNIAGKQAPYKQYLENTIKTYNNLATINKEKEFSQQEIQQQVFELRDLKHSGEFVKNAFEASNLVEYL